MFCDECGAELPDGTQVCTYCGARIHANELSSEEPIAGSGLDVSLPDIFEDPNANDPHVLDESGLFVSDVGEYPRHLAADSINGATGHELDEGTTDDVSDADETTPLTVHTTDEKIVFDPTELRAMPVDEHEALDIPDSVPVQVAKDMFIDPSQVMDPIGEEPYASQREPMRAGLLIGEIALVVAAIAVGVVVFVMPGLSTTKRVAEETVVAQKPGDTAESNMGEQIIPVEANIHLTITVPNLDGEGSRIPMHVVGTTLDNKHVDEVVYVEADGNGLKLFSGTYDVTVAGSPVSSSGSIYEVPEGAMRVSIDKIGVVTVEQEQSWELREKEASETTEEEVAAACELLGKDPAKEPLAQKLIDAAYARIGIYPETALTWAQRGYTQQQQSTQQHNDASARQQAEEAAKKQAEEEAKKQAEEAARKQAEEEAARQAAEAARQAEEAAQRAAEEAARQAAEAEQQQQQPPEGGSGGSESGGSGSTESGGGASESGSGGSEAPSGGEAATE